MKYIRKGNDRIYFEKFAVIWGKHFGWEACFGFTHVAFPTALKAYKFAEKYFKEVEKK
jgi:hypothetical protein